MSEIFRIKSVDLYRSFTAEDWHWFGKFVRSPYFNSDEDLVNITGLLRKYAPEFKVSRRAFFSRAFAGETFDDAKLRRKFNLLAELAHDYIRVKEATGNHIASEVELLKQFRIRRYEKGFNDQCKKLETMIGQAEGAYSEDLHAIYRFQQEQSFFIEEKGNRALDPNIEASSQALDRYFMVEKLKLLCAAENLKKISNIERMVGMEKPLMEYIKTSSWKNDPLITVYLNMLTILREPDPEESFRELMQTLLSGHLQISRDDLENVIITARNYCIRKINAGNKDYFYPLFDLYKLELRQLPSTEEITTFTYKNVVTTSLILEEYEWTKSFIDEYKHRVEGVSGPALYRYNMAKLLFGLQQYKEVKRWLQFSEFPEAMLDADARIILVKTYLVTGDDEAAGNACENLLKFLKRTRELAYHKDHYMNFSRLVLRWLKEGGPHKKASPRLLRYGINLKPMAEGQWLLQVMQE